MTPFVRLTSVEKHHWITQWCCWISYWMCTEFPSCWLYRCGLFLNVSFHELSLRKPNTTLKQQWQNLLNKVWRDKGELFPHVWFLWLQYVEKIDAFLEFQNLIQWENIFFPTSHKIDIDDEQWEQLLLVECLWFCHEEKLTVSPEMSTEERMVQICSSKPKKKVCLGLSVNQIDMDIIKNRLHFYVEKK